MPTEWSKTPEGHDRLTLWPHQSLPPRGFVLFIGATCVMLTLPLLALLGSVLLWALLPFLMAAVAGVWFAIHRNRRAVDIRETLTLYPHDAHLLRQSARRPPQEWTCNRYWARAELHPASGPVPNYVTLSGNGRTVEVGAFLSEEERVALYHELSARLRAAAE
ncbi:MAG: DUF2244 domain-containing protein [Pseudomonadota bacterium]|nr:DUF2244 domain-containing protein [Pseudomonadota bacterium]